MNNVKTLQDAIKYFSDEQVCIDAIASLRWPDGKPECPACQGRDHYYLASQKRWKCKECWKQFSVKVGTIFEDSPISLTKWLPVMWMIANCRNGVSSYEVHRAIGVTQKSAWFMLHRIRLAMQSKSWMVGKIGGPGNTVEVDETYVGGVLKNMHKSRKKDFAGSGAAKRNKTVVMGAIDRDSGQARAEIIPFAGRDPMQSLVKRNVKFGTTVYTDDHVGYDGLGLKFDHDVINHTQAYVNGRVHTNGIENFWSLLKRQLNGTYIAVEPYHLHRYVDEQVFRYNNRKDSKGEKVPDSVRFQNLLTRIAGKRLTFAEVTGKVGETKA